MKTLRLVPALLATLATVVPSGSFGDGPPTPIPSGLVENVEVKLVILDVQVLDRRGRPVPGLGRDDFDVWIDGGRPVPVATFDAACSDAAEKPVVVLAFDYQHLVGRSGRKPFCPPGAPSSGAGSATWRRWWSP